MVLCVFQGDMNQRNLHSFPTRRSSDLEGRTIQVRYCPRANHYHVTGSVAVGWDLQGEVWPNQATLVHVITEFERDGYVPANDEGTRSIRARLMVPGWDRFEYPGSGGAWS